MNTSLTFLPDEDEAFHQEVMNNVNTFQKNWASWFQIAVFVFGLGVTYATVRTNQEEVRVANKLNQEEFRIANKVLQEEVRDLKIELRDQHKTREEDSKVLLEVKLNSLQYQKDIEALKKKFDELQKRLEDKKIVYQYLAELPVAGGKYYTNK